MGTGGSWMCYTLIRYLLIWSTTEANRDWGTQIIWGMVGASLGHFLSSGLRFYNIHPIIYELCTPTKPHVSELVMMQPCPNLALCLNHALGVLAPNYLSF